MACWVHVRDNGEAVDARSIRELEREWLQKDDEDDLGLDVTGLERDYWLGTEAGLLGCHTFHGQYAGGDGSEHKGEMGAGCCIQGHSRSELGLQWRLVGPHQPTSGRARKEKALIDLIAAKSELTEQEWALLNITDLEPMDYVQVRGLFFRPAGFQGMRCSVKVGRSIEGATSNRAELAALAEVLKQANTATDLLYLCDSEAALTKTKEWIGEGGRRTLTEYPDADILKEIIQLLHSRVQAGGYTAMVKVRAHRGEPLNEKADWLAEAGRKADEYQWNERTGRFVFSCKSTAHGTRTRTWSAGIRKIIRSQAAQVCVHLALQSSAKAWRRDNIDSRRRREEICEETCAQAGEGFKMNEGEWATACTDWRRGAEVGHPASNSWTVDFLTRRGESREYMGKWLKNKGIPWKTRRRLMQANTNTFPCGAVLHRWRLRTSKACEVCQKLGGLDSDKAPPECLGHIQSAYCLGQVDTARAAHNRCAMQLQHDLNQFKAGSSTLEFITLEAEQSFKTLWEKHGFQDVCPFEDFEKEVAACERQRPASRTEREDMTQRLRDTAADTNTPLDHVCSICGESMKDFNGDELTLCGLSCHTACWLRRDEIPDPIGRKYWARVKQNIASIAQKRIDGVAIDRKKREIFLIEFKRTSDAMEDYRTSTEIRAKEQYGSITPGFQQVARQHGWQVSQINFITGNRSVSEKSWTENLTALRIPKEHWNKIRKRLMTVLLHEHEHLFQSYWANRYGFAVSRESRCCLEQVMGE